MVRSADSSVSTEQDERLLTEQKLPSEQELTSELRELKREKKQRDVYYSFIGRIGRGIEPLFKPLGFSWKEGVALITGFVAKEVVVSTLGVLYAGEADDAELGSVIKERSGLTPITAFAFLVFVLIYTPCLATIAAIRQETRSWKWTVFSIGYQITLAWVLAFLIVRIGGLLV